MIEFDPVSHRYWDERGDVPSVSKIIKEMGLTRPYYGYEAASRGKTVHHIVELLDMGELVEIEPRFAGYVQAYQSFLSDHKPEWALIEQVVWHDELRYAGTLDRAGVMGKEIVVLDIKTGAMEKWHALQTVAYEIAAAWSMELEATARYGLYIKNDGTYKLQKYPNKLDHYYWEAMAKAYHGRILYG